jgi:hypothetical protein
VEGPATPPSPLIHTIVTNIAKILYNAIITTIYLFSLLYHPRQ